MVAFIQYLGQRSIVDLEFGHLLEGELAIHQCFKCWWLALAEQKTITKPLITSSFNPVLPEDLGYLVPAILYELLK